jgi:hypothetical protein
MVLATPIFRCGNTYSNVRCTDGKVLESSDPRTAAQRAQAHRMAERERQEAHRMETERHEREAAMKPLVATGFDSRASGPNQKNDHPAPGRKPVKRKGKKEHRASVDGEKDFVAVEPPKHK